MLSSNTNNVQVVSSLDELEKIFIDTECEDIWCIGGASIYEQMLSQKENFIIIISCNLLTFKSLEALENNSTMIILLKQKISEIYLTRVEGDFECDTTMQNLFETLENHYEEDLEEKNFSREKQSYNGIDFRFQKFIKKS